MRINILKLVPSFHQGGSENQAVQLLEILKDVEELRVDPACLNRDGVLRSRVEEIGYEEFPDYPLTSFYDLNFVRQLRLFVNYLRAKETVILETSDFYTNVFGMIAGAIARVPIRIATKRETGSRSLAQSFVERFVFRFASVILANSQSVRNRLVESGVPASKIEVVYNDVDFKKFAVKENRTEICRLFGLPSEEALRFVTIVANFRSEIKNQKMFLRTAKRISEKIDEARFVLAGEGELLADNKKFAEELGIASKCFFLGRTENIEKLLSISDVCALTSRFEGSSNAIIEYMAAGKPVVATNVGGASEAIEDSRSGFLVESDDDAALADRVIELLLDNEKNRSFGMRGRSIADSKFSIAARRKKMLELYERLFRERVEAAGAAAIVSSKGIN